MNAVEAVARAICKSRTCQGVACCQWQAQGGRLQCPVRNGAFDDAARAALAAIRTPTPGMVDAARAEYIRRDATGAQHWETIHAALVAAIDAAMEPGS